MLSSHTRVECLNPVQGSAQQSLFVCEPIIANWSRVLTAILLLRKQALARTLCNEQSAFVYCCLLTVRVLDWCCEQAAKLGWSAGSWKPVLRLSQQQLNHRQRQAEDPQGQVPEEGRTQQQRRPGKFLLSLSPGLKTATLFDAHDGAMSFRLPITCWALCWVSEQGGRTFKQEEPGNTVQKLAASVGWATPHNAPRWVRQGGSESEAAARATPERKRVPLLPTAPLLHHRSTPWVECLRCVLACLFSRWRPS